MPSLLIRSPAVRSGDLAAGSLSDAGRVGEETETECREVMKQWLRVSLALLLAGRDQRGGKGRKEKRERLSCDDARFHASQLLWGGWCRGARGLERRVAANPSLAVVPGSLCSLECGCVQGCSPSPGRLALHAPLVATRPLLYLQTCALQKGPRPL